MTDEIDPSELGAFTNNLPNKEGIKKLVDKVNSAGPTYTAGDNVQISDENVISATDTKYTAGDNVAISEQNVISATDTKYTAGTGIAISEQNVISASGGEEPWVLCENKYDDIIQNYTTHEFLIMGKKFSTTVNAIFRAPNDATIQNKQGLCYIDLELVEYYSYGATRPKSVGLIKNGNNLDIGRIKVSAENGGNKSFDTVIMKTLEGVTIDSTNVDTYISDITASTAEFIKPAHISISGSDSRMDGFVGYGNDYLVGKTGPTVGYTFNYINLSASNIKTIKNMIVNGSGTLSIFMTTAPTLEYLDDRIGEDYVTIYKRPKTVNIPTPTP